MRVWLILIVVFTCFSCKVNSQETEKKKVGVEQAYDFSSIEKDTLIIEGKHLLYVKPSQKEFEIIKDIEGVQALNNAFNFYASNIIDSLKSQNLASITSKRVLGIITKNDTIYIDRLNTKKFNTHNHFSIYYINTCNYKSYTYRARDNPYFVIDKLHEDMSCDSIIEQKYVIAKNGLNIRKAGGQVAGKFNNGDTVNVIGYTKDSIEIKDKNKIVKGRWAIINYEDFEDGRRHKKRYVFEGYLGDIEDVKVYDEDLIYGSVIKTPAEQDYNDDAYIENLSDYFKYELISASKFNSVNQDNSYFLTKNLSIKITKNEDETENFNLPIKDSILTFKSKMDYSVASYTYYGDIDVINSYLVYGVYYKAEEALFSVIDKETGETKFMFPEFPNFSPNKKRIICFSYNIYSEINYLEIYSVKPNQTIILDYVFTFPNWINFESDNVKWLSNDTIVFKIVNPNIYNGSEVVNPQYLKLQFKK